MFKNTRLIIVTIALLIGILISSCSQYRKTLKSTNINLKYSTAVALYDKGDFHRAMTLFDELLIYYRGTDTSEKINYYFAYCYFGEGDFLQAGYYFTKFTSTFPTSKYAEECQYMSAYCQYMYSPKYSLDQTISVDAIKEFQLFINSYPKSKLVDSCNSIIDELRGKLETKSYEIAKLYYKIEDYQAAVIAFKNLLKDYPDTKYKENAYYYILVSYYYYALGSVEGKKNERLNNAKDAYSSLFAAFPQTKFEKDAKSMLKNINKELQKNADKEKAIKEVEIKKNNNLNTKQKS
ncbi:MAG: outer membrane protein assembly factor BamD [Bacteroidota bacterium]